MLNQAVFKSSSFEMTKSSVTSSRDDVRTQQRRLEGEVKEVSEWLLLKY